MSDSWIAGNLESTLEMWNEKLAELWQLLTQSPATFKGGAIWNVMVNIHGALQALAYKEKKNLTTGETVIQYDRLTPKTQT